MDFLNSLKDAAHQRPLAAILATNLVTAGVAIYVISDGHPGKWLYKKVFQAVLAAVPSSIVDAEQEKLRIAIEKDVIGHDLAEELVYTELPSTGLAHTEITTILDRYAEKDKPHWKKGKVSGCVYHGGDDLTALMTAAFSRYALSNPLHPDVFPSLRKMEAEVVAMTLRLFNASATGCGTMTSGGTESILMACKAYRDYARKTRGVVEPELVVPCTAHAAFDKACSYFGIKLIHIPVDQTTFRVDVQAMLKAVTKNTIGLVCSAPNYPQGVIDPVPELGAAALARGIPLHVDCCLGSFLVAFAGAAGHPTRVPFDFSVPGVTSISVDTHKYGFAPKGSSVIMYSRSDLRRSQYFVASEWTGGIYASPSIAGSRAGALIAACWATMMNFGVNGYTASAKTILVAAQTIAGGVKEMTARGAGIELYGEPDLSVVCFGPVRGSLLGASGKPLNIYNVADAMSSRGWNLNTLQNPPCLHICVTYANAGQAGTFLSDLAEAVEEVRTAPPGKFKDGSGAMYGMAASIPDKSLVDVFVYNFLDAMYAAKVK